MGLSPSLEVPPVANPVPVGCSGSHFSTAAPTGIGVLALLSFRKVVASCPVVEPGQLLLMEGIMGSREINQDISYDQSGVKQWLAEFQVGCSQGKEFATMPTLAED